MDDVHYSSEKNDWGTPWDFFDRLDERFGFDFDVCASQLNAKCPGYWTEEDDSLSFEWPPARYFMNPPYGRCITGKWTSHAAAQRDSLIVGLLPSRTDTKWWHEDVLARASEVIFVKGRIKFQGAKDGAPFPSAVVLWHPTRLGISFSTMRAKL